MRVRPSLALALLLLAPGAAIAAESAGAVAKSDRPGPETAPVRKKKAAAPNRTAMREQTIGLIKTRIATLPAKDTSDARRAASPVFAVERQEDRPVLMAAVLVEEKEDPERIKREVDEAITSHDSLASPALYKKDLTKKVRFETGLPLGPEGTLKFFRLSW